MITQLINTIWKTETIPEDWHTVLIHPLYKEGDTMDVTNYRGISLLPVAYKILSKALQTRIESKLDKILGGYEAGFRKIVC